MTDIHDLLETGAYRPPDEPDLDRVARDATRKRSVRGAGVAAVVAAVVALVMVVEWPMTGPAITDPVATVTVPQLPRVESQAALGELPDTVTVLDGRDGTASWELGVGIDPEASMLHLLFSTGGARAATRMPVDAAGRVWPGSLTTTDQGQFVYGISAPEAAVFELDLADGTQIDAPATRVRVDDPPVVFTAFALPVTADATEITARDRRGDVVGVYDVNDLVGATLFNVLQEQPWLAPEADDTARPAFDPTTFQDQYMVATSVATALFGDRAAGARLDGRRIELAVTNATAADTDRLRAELSTDPRMAEAADRFTIVPIEHTRAELDTAQARLVDDLPEDLLRRVTVSVEPLEDRVTIVAADDSDAAAVREAIPDLPDFVHIVIDRDRTEDVPA